VAAGVQLQLRAVVNIVAAVPSVMTKLVRGLSAHAPREPCRRWRGVPERPRDDAPARPARLRAVLRRRRARVRAVAHLFGRRRAAEARHPPIRDQPGGGALALVEQLVGRLNECIPFRLEAGPLVGGGAVGGGEREHEVAECLEVARRMVAGVVTIPAAPARAQLEHAKGQAIGSFESRVLLREVLKEGTARLVRPARNV